MRAHILSPRKPSGLFVLAAILVLAAGACVPRKPLQDATPTASQAAVNPDALDVNTAYSEGLNSFWSGDYATAAILFESLARRQDDQTLRSKALYGLACSRLAGARTEEEFRAAREVWQEWERACSGSVSQADPRMVTPFLNNPKLFIPAREARLQPQQQAKPAHGDVELAKRLQEKEKEVLNLQKQIKALEAISREIQAKKKMTQ